MCTLCYVDDAMKKTIAAYGASFRKATASPFGASDEIGMLNLITAELRDAILSTADAGKMIDLSVDYFVGMPSWVGANDPNYQMWMTHTPAGEKITNSAGVAPELNDLVSYSSDAVSMYTHCGTHIDALNHFGYHGVIFNGYKAADHIGSRHWDVAGVNKQPPIVARGVLLDVAGLHGVDILPPSQLRGLAGRGAARRGPSVITSSSPRGVLGAEQALVVFPDAGARDGRGEDPALRQPPAGDPAVEPVPQVLSGDSGTRAPGSPRRRAARPSGRPGRRSRPPRGPRGAPPTSASRPIEEIHSPPDLTASLARSVSRT